MRGLIRRVIVCVTSSASSRVSAVSVSRSFYWYKLETRDRVYKYTPLSKYCTLTLYRRGCRANPGSHTYR